MVVTDIGHPPADPAWPALVTDQHAAEWLRRLRSRDHKGARGRVVIVGGDAGMIGAARMAGRSAFGAGAGLVHVVAPPEYGGRAGAGRARSADAGASRSTSRLATSCSTWCAAPMPS